VRFRLGSVPDDAKFDPAGAGWVRLNEPRFGWMMLMVLPVSVLLVCALSALWALVLRMHGAPSALEGVVTPAVAGLFLLGCAAIIVGHEVIHVLALPGLGLTAEAVLGFWPQTLTPYVAYEGETSWARQIVVGLAPLLALSIAPLLVGVMFGWAPLWVVATSLLNGLGASADVVGVALVIWQVPRSARVRSKGLATWWRLPG
jgi:hypothetical protein